MSAALGVARTGLRSALVAGTVGLSIVAVGFIVAQPRELRMTVAVAAVLTAVAVGLAWPRHMLVLLVVWLVALGLVRRLLSLSVPSTGHDPLLLVEPAVLALLLVPVTQRRPLAHRSALTTSVLVVSVLLAASALNPRQGGPAVGAAGLLFLLVPTAGFWIGRMFCDDRLYARILTIVAFLALPVAAYGLFQTFFGFPHWDELWIRQTAASYQALNVGSAVRAFSTFPSFAEYAYFVAVGLCAWLAFGLRFLRLPFTAPAVALLGTALVLASVRLVVFLAAAAILAMLVVKARLPAPVAALAVLLALIGVSAAVSRLAPATYTPGASGALLQHQVQGLSNPTGSQSSTLLIHLSLLTEGVRSAVTHPAGYGAGAVSIAASRFGGTGHGTEADPSNLAVAAGLPGLLAYFTLAAIAFVRAFRLAVERRDALSLTALAIVVVVFLQWFNGGQYGIALLVWLTLGWIDRSATNSAELASPSRFEGTS